MKENPIIKNRRSANNLSAFGGTAFYKTKRTVCLLMACLLMVMSLGGCSQTGSETEGTETLNAGGGASGSAGGAKGRFMESEIVLPEEVDICSMGMLSDGTIQILGYNLAGEMMLLKSGDTGANWESQKIMEGWESIWSGWGIATSPDGTAFVAGIFGSPDGEEFGAVLINPDGSAKGLKLALPQLEEKFGNDSNFVTDAGFDGDGNLFVRELGGSILKVNTETGECISFCDADGAGISYFAVAGNKLLAVTKQEIMIYNTQDGTKLDKDEALNEWFQGNSDIAARESQSYPALFSRGVEDGSIVYADHRGVFYHQDGGSISEQLINAELNSLGDTSTSLYSIVMVDKENFLIHIAGGATGGSKILKYSYDRDVSAVPDQELVVYSLYDFTALRQAISVYQKKNQNSSVRLVTGIGESGGVTVDDALQTLNTDILAGNGPDVLILDGLPVDSYIEKGILADISDVVGEVEASDGLFSNIKNAYEKDGSIYQMPAKFYGMIAEGDETAITAAGNLVSYADHAEQLKEEGQEADVFSPMMAEDILEELYFADSANWISEDGTLDETKLKTWLAQVKRIWDVGAQAAEGEESGKSFRYLKLTDLIGSITSGGIGLAGGDNQLAFGTLTSADDLVFLRAIEKQGSTSYGLLNGDQSKSFVPYLQLGVNSGSSQIDLAKDFVKTLLGKECSSISGNGFPVNKTAYDTIAEEKKTAYSGDNAGGGVTFTEDGGDGEDAFFTIEFENLTDQDIEKLTKILESLTTPVNTDRVLRSLILEQGQKYLKGEQSIEDSITAISQKVKLYLAE